MDQIAFKTHLIDLLCTNIQKKYRLQGPTYTFDDRRTRHHACNSPLIPDPYEIGTIAIKKSKLHGSGEGVFLKVDVPAGRIIAFYNGVHKTELEIVSTILPDKYLIIFAMNNMSERNRKYCRRDNGSDFLLPALFWIPHN